jgi:beta-glucosidase
MKGVDDMVRGLLAVLSMAACLATSAIAAEAPGSVVSTRVEALLSRMTLDEKLGQLIQLPGGRQRAVNSRIDDALRARVRAGSVGSLLNVAGAGPARDLQRVAVEESRLGIPLLYGLDVIHGYRTIFPVPLAMAATSTLW